MPSLPAVAPPADAGSAAPPVAPPSAAPKRTLKTVGLFGDLPVHNLVIDHTFDTGSPGVGRWYSSLGSGLTGTGPDPSTVVTSSSPHGMSLAVGAVSDTPEGAAPRTFSLLAQVPGGTGPFLVSLWLSTERPLEGDLPTLVRVSLASATAGTLVGAEIPRDEAATRTIAGRTWYRFEGEVAGDQKLGAFLVVRLRASRNRWWLQAPFVAPKALLASASLATASAPIARPVARPFALDDAERAAIAAYRRIPLDYGVGRPR